MSTVAEPHPESRERDVVPRAAQPYMPQLDGLRAWAVMAVVASHYARDVPFFASHGPLGVQLFFVLSGFLITGILLRVRADAGPSGIGIGVLGRFYARRALRLLPLFYLVLFVAYLADLETIRQSILWHAFYGSNLRFAALGAWEGSLSHFWSLAVEEQFYLMWPFLILWTPRRWLLQAILGVVCIGPAFRAIAEPAGMSQMSEWVLPPGSFDALGLGALLATSHDGRGEGEHEAGATRWLSRSFWPALAAALVVIPVWSAGRTIPRAWPWTLFVSAQGLAWALVFVGLTSRSTGQCSGWARLPLCLPPIRYLGRISYGIYVLHPLTPHLVAAAATSLGLELSASLGMRFTLMTTVTIGLAALSWHTFEGPINELRRRIPYEERSRTATPHRIGPAAPSGRGQV
jgi:peptidoglycan/LPS O-acetylase OafA/YrhL